MRSSGRPRELAHVPYTEGRLSHNFAGDMEIYSDSMLPWESICVHCVKQRSSIDDLNLLNVRPTWCEAKTHRVGVRFRRSP